MSFLIFKKERKHKMNILEDMKKIEYFEIKLLIDNYFSSLK